MTEDQSDKDDESYGEHLFRYTFDEGRQEPRFLIFRGLQLMNIYNMQNDLAKLKHDIMTTKTAEPQQTESLTKTLHNYGNDSYPHDMVPTNPPYSKRNPRL